MMHRRTLVSGLALLAFGGASAKAQTETERAEDRSKNPFATRFIALQLSDDDPKKQRLVLSVASNLLRAYGPDTIAVEVVTFGPGIDLLRDTNEHRALVDSLVTQGVRFDVCGNTLDTIERETGKRPKINPRAIEVLVGVGHLLELSEKKYTIVRP